MEAQLGALPPTASYPTTLTMLPRGSGKERTKKAPVKEPSPVPSPEPAVVEQEQDVQMESVPEPEPTTLAEAPGPVEAAPAVETTVEEAPVVESMVMETSIVEKAGNVIQHVVEAAEEFLDNMNGESSTEVENKEPETKLNMEERKAKMEQLRAKMVSCPC